MGQWSSFPSEMDPSHFFQFATPVRSAPSSSFLFGPRFLESVQTNVDSRQNRRKESCGVPGPIF